MTVIGREALARGLIFSSALVPLPWTLRSAQPKSLPSDERGSNLAADSYCLIKRGKAYIAMASSSSFSSSSSKKYASRLVSKLSALQETSSKESLQTLAKWIGFHRKHSAALAEVLTGECLRGNKGSVTVAVINELLLLHKDDPARWERLSDLRLAVGEALVQAESLPKEKFGSLLTEWDEHSVFGGPTLIHELRRRLSGSASAPSKTSSQVQAATTKATSETKIPKQEESDEPAVSAAEKKKEEEPADELKPKATTHASESTKPSSRTADSASPPPAAASAAPSKQEIVVQPQYDFESKNIPERTVEPREFMDPCRAIATLQIARDLSNDNAVQMSSLLQSMPEDIRAFTAQLAETGGVMQLEEAQARDFSKRCSDQLIDADLMEALQNVRTLRDIVRKQSEARQQLLELLVASRCNFGAEQAAEAYYKIDSSRLKRRAQILTDAMELEGLDITQEESTAAKAVKNTEEEELPPLAWYKPEEKSSPNKRPKVE